jgi:hypothetical protein
MRANQSLQGRVNPSALYRAIFTGQPFSLVVMFSTLLSVF